MWPRLLLIAPSAAQSWLVKPKAGTTTAIYTGKTKHTSDALSKKVPAPSWLRQATLTPSFTGFKSRCLLRVGGMNTVLSKLKCWTQMTLVLRFWGGFFWFGVDLDSRRLKFPSGLCAWRRLTSEKAPGMAARGCGAAAAAQQTPAQLKHSLQLVVNTPYLLKHSSWSYRCHFK